MKYGIAGAILIAVFLAGYLTGRRAPVRFDTPVADLQITRTSLLDALEPSVIQRAELEAMMEAARLESDSIMASLLGQIRDRTQLVERDMRRVLSVEQNRRLDSLIGGPTPPNRTRRE